MWFGGETYYIVMYKRRNDDELVISLQSPLIYCGPERLDNFINDQKQA